MVEKSIISNQQIRTTKIITIIIIIFASTVFIFESLFSQFSDNNDVYAQSAKLIDTKLNSPIVDIVFHNGLLYVSHRDKISTVDITTGTVKDIIVGLPEN